jgi:hypothetical protein
MADQKPTDLKTTSETSTNQEATSQLINQEATSETSVKTSTNQEATFQMAVHETTNQTTSKGRHCAFCLKEFVGSSAW